MPYPYTSTRDIPLRVRNVLPPYAQHIFQGAFNSAWKQYTEQTGEEREETAHRVAWNAVKKVYEKNNEGIWVLKEQRKQRPTEEVLENHLKLRKEGKTKEDIDHNYSKKCILVSNNEVLRRHTGVKKSAQKLNKDLPEATFRYEKVICVDDLGYLKWAADSSKGYIEDGVDSFVVKEGLILYQTIHYTVKKK